MGKNIEMMIVIFVILFIPFSSGYIIINEYGFNMSIYQWSAYNVFKNDPFYLTLDLSTLDSLATTNTTNTTNTTTCLLILHQYSVLTTKNLIDSLSSLYTIECIIVQVDGMPISNLQLWVHSNRHYLNTLNYPVGLVFTSKKLKNNTNLNATFYNWDVNPFFDYNISEIVVYILICLFNVIVLIIGLYRLYERYLNNLLEFNIATICISLETASCLLRAIEILIKVLENIVPFLNVQHSAVLFVIDIAYPCTLSSGIFLIFFWIDITSFSLYRGSFLDKFFWPCISLVVIITVITDIAAFMSLVNFNVAVVNYMVILILAISLIVSIIYFISAFKIYNYIKRRKQYEEKFYILIYKIIVSGLITIGIVIIAFTTITTIVVPTILITRYFTEILLCSRSAILIDIFKIKIQKSSNDKKLELSNTTTATPSFEEPQDAKKIED